MSSPYPVLDNKPIDQWRVTELKEELKKRKLATKGLKDDLIRRLDEALRAEIDDDKQEDHPSPNEMENKAPTGDEEVHAIPDETVSGKEEAPKDEEEEHASPNDKVSENDEEALTDDEAKAVHIEIDTEKKEEAVANEREITKEEVVHREEGSDNDQVSNDIDSEATTKVKSEKIGNNVIGTPIVLETKVDDSNGIEKLDNHVSTDEAEDIPSKLDQAKVEKGESMITNNVVEGGSSTTSVTVSVDTNVKERSVLTVTSSSVEPPHGDAEPSDSSPSNQVFEVSPSLGFQVKSDSISTDTVSINDKNELKDNLNADNFHIELDNVMPDMVQPSSNDVPQNGGDIHPPDDQEPSPNQGSIKDIDCTETIFMDHSKINDSVEEGSPEKLNLDRSSGDDFMEEDVLESKQVESKHVSNEVEVKSESTKDHVNPDEIPNGVTKVDFPPHLKDTSIANNSVALQAEKRKFAAQEVVGNNEIPKRQRRWNAEPIKVTDLQSSNLTPLTTPKDGFQSKFPKRSFNRSDSTLTGGDTPKERIVPRSPRSPTTSLKIDRFLRPFTLKAVQELLSKTGNICSFWMDSIKTHCYVTFSSVEEAVETRNAVYNLQWPPNGGRLLIAEFVDPQEVKLRAEAPPKPLATPVSNKLPPPPAPAPSSSQPPAPSQTQPSSVQNVLKQQLPPKLPPPPPSDSHTIKERLPLPPPPSLPKKPDPPIVTLDDLFKKTRATPRIYYLPLSDEQVAAKLKATN